jgi:hypothetical protein
MNSIVKAMGRDPYDGKPYYCKLCGAGYGEYIACEDPDCQLESPTTAQLRAARRRPKISDTPARVED